jgi:hypothetical protein
LYWATNVSNRALLLEDIGGGRLGRLTLEREMHPFVAAILLRMARLAALDLDAEPQPPHRQFA